MDSNAPGGGFNTSGAASYALPLLALAAGLASRPGADPSNGAAHAFAMLDKSNERDREIAANQAVAKQLEAMGLKTDSALPAAEQLRFGTLQWELAKSLATDAKEREKRAEDLRSRGVFGNIANVNAAVGTELPEVLTARMGEIAPEVGRSTEIAQGFEKTLGNIRESAKRLETARAFGRPFEETSTVDISPRASGAGGGPTVSLLSGEELPVPVPRGMSLGVDPVKVEPITTKRVPDNVHAMQRFVMETGAAPKPEEASSLFDVPLTKFPGGQAFLDAQNKSPYAPYTHFATDAKGGVTPITIQTDPRSGQPVQVTGATVEGAGQPQKPERAQQHELLQSLGYVIAGVPEKAMPEHRALSPQAAQTVRDTIGHASQQVSPQLAASDRKSVV